MGDAHGSNAKGRMVLRITAHPMHPGTVDVRPVAWAEHPSAAEEPQVTSTRLDPQEAW